MPDTEDLQKLYKGLLDLMSLGKKDPTVVLKQFSEPEEQKALGVVLTPDVFDLHQDIYSKEQVRMACEGFNAHCMKGNIQHAIQYEKMEFTKSFIQEVDCMMGDQFIREGTWMAEAHFPDKLLWESIKEKGFTGFSIGCLAKYEDIDEGDE